MIIYSLILSTKLFKNSPEAFALVVLLNSRIDIFNISIRRTDVPKDAPMAQTVDFFLDSLLG